MRRQFGKTLIELARKDERIVLVIGDVTFDEFRAFADEFPKRFFDVGICEQTMVGLVGGMASRGLRPVVHSVTPFVLERPLEQIKLDIDEANLPVILMGYDDYPTYGPTHTPMNVPATVALFKNVRGYYPTSNFETEKALLDAYLRAGPAFIWLRKSDLPYIPDGKRCA